MIRVVAILLLAAFTLGGAISARAFMLVGVSTAARFYVTNAAATSYVLNPAGTAYVVVR